MAADSPSSETNACPQCGTALPPVGVAGHCPRWLGRTEFREAESEEKGEAWTVLGDCELLEEIGRGGMGVVYKARQRRLGREVAVKVLRGGEFAGAEARGRFKAEAENAARLRHPGIVAVYDFGEEQGVCWISMELIAGRNLDDETRHQPMPARAAAGVLHRDLKPSNIPLDAGGAPHIADFGIALRMEGTQGFTRTGQMLGSPGFTAPEQALRGLADARTDVYGLGAILYSVLTSRPPFHGPTADSVLLQLREDDPLPPRRLNPDVPRDLENIALKCLAREPSRRYASAAAVAADLTAFLEGRTVVARAVSSMEKIWCWCRRRPALAAALLLAVAAMAAGTVVSLLLAQQGRESPSKGRPGENRALAAAEETRRALYAATMLRAYDDLSEGSPLAAPALAGLMPWPGQPDLRGWEWHWMNSQHHQGTLRVEENRIGEPRSVAWSPDGKQIAHGSGSILYDAATGQPASAAVTDSMQRFRKEVGGPPISLAWSPDQTRLAIGFSDAGHVLLLDTRDGTWRALRPIHSGWVRALAFNPDGTRLATAGRDATVKVLAAETLATLLELRDHRSDVRTVAWSADGRTLASADREGRILKRRLPRTIP